tara:strand:+ start:6454 stop:7299 length:846 start_codon:yes stop_codon:yes gene_type:complete
MRDFCLGTVQFGIPYGINRSEELPSSSEVESIFQFFFEKGGIYIDTARAYGDSEKIISKFIDEKAKVITKVNIKNNFNEAAQNIEQSIKNLNVDNIDTLLIHNVEALSQPDLPELCSKIKSYFPIDNIGISIYSEDDITNSIHNYKDLLFFDVIQVPANVLDRRFIESEVFKYLQEKKIRFDLRSIFLQGALINKENAKKLLPDGLEKYLNSWFNYLNKNKINAVEGVISNLPRIENSLTLFGCVSRSEIEEINSYFDNVSKKDYSNDDEIPLRVIDPRLW